jgi:hypothetical protein
MIKKEWRVIRWVVFNVATVLACVLGLLFHVEPAANVFRFLVWLTCPVIVIAALSEDGKAQMKKIGPSVPPLLTLMIDIGVACMCASRGWFGYAAMIASAGMCSFGVHCGDSGLSSDKPKAPRTSSGLWDEKE